MKTAQAVSLFPPGEPDRNAFEVPLSLLQPDPDQPRQRLDGDALEELSASIATRGIINPLTVCRVGDGYRIIAGERRFRAASKAGLTSVPVRVIDDEARLAQIREIQLIENLQREDLNPVDEAVALAQVRRERGLSIRDLATHLNMSKSNVSRKLQVLEWSEELQAELRDGRLSLNEAKRLAKDAEASEVPRKKRTKRGRPKSLFRLVKGKGGGFDLTVTYRPERGDKDALIARLEALLLELKGENVDGISFDTDVVKQECPDGGHSLGEL